MHFKHKSYQLVDLYCVEFVYEDHMRQSEARWLSIVTIKLSREFSDQSQISRESNTLLVFYLLLFWFLGLDQAEY